MIKMYNDSLPLLASSKESPSHAISYPLGSSTLATSFIASIASPLVKPGEGSPLIAAEL